MAARPPGEFEIIARFTRALPLAGRGILVGPGDDAAVLRPVPGEDLVATVDAVVSGVHFDRRFAPADVGWKALAVNLSDLAAMGARPVAALVALALPRGTAAAELRGLARGLGACARAYGIPVIGGNVTRAGAISVTITALGAVPEGRAVLRSGARAGDLVVVTGTVGDAALGLRRGAAPALARRQRRPMPRVAAGLALAGLVRAAIDVSDGLVQDLGHLCRASGVGARIGVAELPLSPAYRRAARRLVDPWAPALGGGEDYELVAAVPPRLIGDVRAAAARARTPITVVGRFVRGAGVAVVGPRGEPVPAPSGHDHLRTRGLASFRSRRPSSRIGPPRPSGRGGPPEARSMWGEDPGTSG
jgi:thiamine-monophosphate kinase